MENKHLQKLEEKILQYGAQSVLYCDAIRDVKARGASRDVGERVGEEGEAWLAAVGSLLVKYGLSVETFVKRYNAVCGLLPQITTESWFREVNKIPSEGRLSTQLGVHLEEFCEMLQEMSSGNEGIDAKMALIGTLLSEVAHGFKTGGATLQIVNRKRFFDSILDQMVTGTGVAQYAGFNLSEGMARVDLANFTKFIDGIPLFKEGGKVAKGPYFVEPDLSGLEG